MGQSEPIEKIQARTLELVDSHGRVSIVLSAADKYPRISLINPDDGHERVVIGMSDKGANISLIDKDGATLVGAGIDEVSGGITIVDKHKKTLTTICSSEQTSDVVQTYSVD